MSSFPHILRKRILDYFCLYTQRPVRSLASSGFSIQAIWTSSSPTLDWLLVWDSRSLFLCWELGGFKKDPQVLWHPPEGRSVIPLGGGTFLLLKNKMKEKISVVLSHARALFSLWGWHPRWLLHRWCLPNGLILLPLPVSWELCSLDTLHSALHILGTAMLHTCHFETQVLSAL